MYIWDLLCSLTYFCIWNMVKGKRMHEDVYGIMKNVNCVGSFFALYREEFEGTAPLFWIGTCDLHREKHLGYVRSCDY